MANPKNSGLENLLLFSAKLQTSFEIRFDAGGVPYILSFGTHKPPQIMYFLIRHAVLLGDIPFTGKRRSSTPRGTAVITKIIFLLMHSPINFTHKRFPYLLRLASAETSVSLPSPARGRGRDPQCACAVGG